jgi:hypothetical protein
MAYKVKNTVTVVLESPEGNAEIVFNKLDTTEVYDILFDAKEGKRIEKREEAISDFKKTMSKAVSVTGIEDESGKKITLDDLQNLKLDYHTLKAISQAYYTLALDIGVKQDLEKKDSKSES